MKSNETEKSFDLAEELKKVFYAGVGAIAITAEKAKELIDELVKKGSLTMEQGKIINEELKHKVKDMTASAVKKGEETCHNIKEKTEETVKNIKQVSEEKFQKVKDEFAILKAVENMSKEEREQLRAKLEEVEKGNEETISGEGW